MCNTAEGYPSFKSNTVPGCKYTWTDETVGELNVAIALRSSVTVETGVAGANGGTAGGGEGGGCVGGGFAAIAGLTMHAMKRR